MRPKFFLIKTYQKKLTKTHTKPTRKIKHKNKTLNKKKNLFNFFINPYLIDIPILNNTHQKNYQKTHKNPQEKTHILFFFYFLIHLFKYKDICFYGLIGLILP
jgi:hypothetical protein